MKLLLLACLIKLGNLVMRSPLVAANELAAGKLKQLIS